MQPKNLLKHTAIAALALSSHVAADLPAYSGPYGVGTIYLETAAESARSITNTTFKKDGKPAFKLDTVLLTLFYPVDAATKSSKPAHPWLPEPRNLIAQGLSNAIGGAVDPQLIQLGFDLFAKNLSVPALVDVPLVAGSSKLPVMIFSHGNPTLSDWYSQFYGEVASRGVVVAAVTHRDGSSPGTVVKFRNGTTYELAAFTQDAVNPAMSETEFHLRQLEMRQAEMTEAARVLQFITNGDGQKVSNSSSRGEGQDLGNWKDRLDISKLIVAGHSFGANTVLRYLREPKPLVPAVAALPFDPGKESGPLTNETVKVPILIPDSEEWSAVPTEFYGQQHFDVVKAIAQGSLDATGTAWFMTLLGTVHTSITDVGIIASGFTKFFTNETQFITLDPLGALKQYVNVTNSFVTFVENKTISGLLATGVTYPNFQLFPNASTLSTPWEVHVAPNASSNSSSGGKKSLGSRASHVPSILELFGTLCMTAGILPILCL